MTEASENEAVRWNRELDRHLMDTGMVDEATFCRFADALAYGSATSVQWLEAKLRILLLRLRGGGTVSVVRPRSDGAVEISTVSEFKDWTEQFFPGVEALMGGFTPHEKWCRCRVCREG